MAFELNEEVVPHVDKAWTSLNTCKKINAENNSRIAEGASIINMAFASYAVAA